LIFGLGAGVIAGLVSAPFFGLIGGLGRGLRTGARVALIVGLISEAGAGLIGAIYGLAKAVYPDPTTGRLQGLLGVGELIVGGLFLGLLFGVLFVPLIALGGGLIGAFIGEVKETGRVSIRLTAALRWSWRRAAIFTLVAGACFGSFWGTVLVLGSFENSTFFLGLGFGGVSGLFTGLIGGLIRREVDDRDYRTPDEGTRGSAFSGVVLGLVGGLAVGTPFGLIVGWGWDPRYGVAWGLAIELLVGLVVGLAGGGMAAIEHSALRSALRRASVMPPHLARFLDYAADHILLQKVGGGYRFVHVLLRDYFADLDADPAQAQSSVAHLPLIAVVAPRVI
jgi:hypothetical protein